MRQGQNAAIFIKSLIISLNVVDAVAHDVDDVEVSVKPQNWCVHCSLIVLFRGCMERHLAYALPLPEFTCLRTDTNNHVFCVPQLHSKLVIENANRTHRHQINRRFKMNGKGYCGICSDSPSKSNGVMPMRGMDCPTISVYQQVHQVSIKWA